MRVQQALNRILREHEGKTLAVITHGGVIQAAFLYFFGLSATATPGVSIENTSITHWVRSGQPPKWVLKRFNDHQHF